jgi:hypothetical protein
MGRKSKSNYGWHYFLNKNKNWQLPGIELALAEKKE